MEALILDTNIVSYIMNGDSRVNAYREHFAEKTLAISFMTVGELYEGAYRKAWDKKKFGLLKEQIKNYLVIPCSPNMCEIWGRLRAERKKQPIAVDDGWIAATAITYECPLVTHNPKDFLDITGLQIITELTTNQE